MKTNSLKNNLIVFTGIVAVLFVVGLVLFSPSQNASAISVSDEIERRMVEMAVQETVQYAAVTALAAKDMENQAPLSEDGYVLSQEEKDQFFGEPEILLAPLEKESTTATIAGAENKLPENTVENVQLHDDSRDPIQVVSEEDSAPELFEEPPITEENPFELSITKSAVPTGEPPTLPTRQPTREIIWFPTHEPTEEPPQVPTPKPTEEPPLVPTDQPTNEPTKAPTPEPTSEPTQAPTQEPTTAPDLFWSAGFETGDISEWTDHGDWLRQGYDRRVSGADPTSPHWGVCCKIHH